MKTFERILKDELLIKTSHLLDHRQHGFLNLKSCTTNMVSFTDSVVLSINDCKTYSTDVIYFDFSKAFDSVSHDLILLKLKYYFGLFFGCRFSATSTFRRDITHLPMTSASALNGSVLIRIGVWYRVKREGRCLSSRHTGGRVKSSSRLTKSDL